MRSYFIRRLLLIPLTLLGVTFVVFALTRILPGGPLEQRMQKAMMAQEGHSAGRSLAQASVLNEDQLIALKRSFLLDKPLVPAFLMWWGIIPSEVMHRDATEIPLPQGEEKSSAKEIFLPMRGADGSLVSKKARIFVDRDQQLSLQLEDGSTPEGWHVRQEGATTGGGEGGGPREIHAVAYRTKFAGVLQWEFRNSLTMGDPVWSLIRERFPISLFYGIITMILTYCICIPLGVLKAIKHRTFIDSASSVGIFLGYSIPGFALGTILVLLFAFRIELFPIGGFTSEQCDSLPLAGKIKDLAHHAVLPLICYLIGAFAMTTMLMKNSLLDNLAADYVRTAVAKGSSFSRSVIGHAMRNSLIPIGTTFGQNITLLVGGSMLIETVFDIFGFGLLGYNALVDRDYTITLAIIFLSGLLMMVGNVLSDLIVAWLNPRIRFE